MEKSYGKGVANHTGPESCGAGREGGDEAFTGESTGRVSSRVTAGLFLTPCLGPQVDHVMKINVAGFQAKSDAVRFWAELIERMRKFSLELHPEKTRLLEFGPYAAENRKKRGHGTPERFNFLGFTQSAGRRGAMDGSRCCDRRFVNDCKRSTRRWMLFRIIRTRLSYCFMTITRATGQQHRNTAS